jgi:hypothetical protein|tara:strand:- start:7325 stop:7684 length:360 start_codon:yes stop_codon:yes gene_type:complete
MTTNLRTEIELRQVYDKVVSFTRTTTGNTAEIVLTVSDYMEEANRVALLVEVQPLYVRFDGSAASGTGAAGDSDATILSLYMGAGQSYTETDIKITGTISIIVVTSGQNGRIRGTVWGR